MVKLMLRTPDGGHVLFIGLTDGNLEKLRAGRPIRFDPADVGLPWRGTIGIFHGRTEAEIEAMLREHDMIGPETRIIREAT